MEILLIEDDPAIRLSLAATLRDSGRDVDVARDGNEGMRQLRAHAYDLVISDVKMPGPDGFTILEYARRTRRSSDIILITGFGAIDDAVTAIKQRATDYLVKPFTPEDLLYCVEQVEARQRLNRETLRPQSDTELNRHGLVGSCAGIAYVREQIDAIGPSDAPVLITGESGTGKELVARALHGASARKDGPFVAINCASFPNTLLEAELFGHERGAFTGADRAREGRFAAASGGTLFLDEISEMEPACQAKLLRVLQERVYSPLGTNKCFELDARILSATNRSLRDLVEAREFREDLYYRVKVLTIELPPLREREGDLVPLCSHFLRKFAGPHSRLRVSAAAWTLLSEYSFPGNVRELEHAIQHGTVLAGASPSDEIQVQHLPSELRTTNLPPPEAAEPQILPLTSTVKAFERKQLLRAVALCGGNRTLAAKALGISRKNFWEKLRRQDIHEAEIAEEIAAVNAKTNPH